MTPAATGRPRPPRRHPRTVDRRAAAGPVHVDAVLSGRQRQWVMNAGVPLLLLSWFRYAVHLVLVLALVLPARGWACCARAREQLVRGASMFRPRSCSSPR